MADTNTEKIFLFECSICDRYEVTKERFFSFLSPSDRNICEALLQKKNIGLMMSFPEGTGCPECNNQGRGYSYFELFPQEETQQVQS